MSTANLPIENNSPNSYVAPPSVPPSPKSRKKTIKYIVISICTICVLITLFILSQIFSSFTINNTWNGIKPGKTTKAEVTAKLGTPIREIDLPFSKGMIYDSGIKAFPNVVIYDEQTSKVEGELILITREKEAKNYYTDLIKLGKPEKIMYSTYAQFSRIFIFPQKGITYSANDAIKMVDAIHYYVPTNLTDYLTRYGKFFNEKNEYKY